jgi:LacI family transcriptional regulator
VKLPDEQLTDAGFVPRILRESSSDGLLINYTDHIPPAMIELIERSQHPSVWLNAKRQHDCVYPDDLDAARRLTALMIEQGHRDITYVDLHFGFDAQTQDTHYSKWDRWTGYEQAMRDEGLTPRRIDYGTLAPGDRKRVRGFWANPAGSWLDGADRPTAAVCYGREDAVPVALAAQKLGLRLPEDLLVTGFADADEALVPALRAPVAVLPHEALGHQAVEMLMAKIREPQRRLAPRAVAFGFHPGMGVAPPGQSL